MSKTTEFRIIIDTNSYAGNFEREMCAYLTGQVGDCKVGEEIAEEVKEDGSLVHQEWWEKHVIQKEDEGCFRPVEIYSNPKYFNNGRGRSFPMSDTEKLAEVKSESLSSIKKTYANLKKPLEKQIIDNAFGSEKEKKECEKQILNFDKQSFDLSKNWTPCPAYHSVCIFVDEKPPKAVLDELKKRVHQFAGNDGDHVANANGSNIKIEGIRMECEEVIIQKKTKSFKVKI